MNFQPVGQPCGNSARNCIPARRDDSGRFEKSLAFLENVPIFAVGLCRRDFPTGRWLGEIGEVGDCHSGESAKLLSWRRSPPVVPQEATGGRCHQPRFGGCPAGEQ